MDKDALSRRIGNSRYFGVANSDVTDLGALQLLTGVWQNADRFAGRGWNMIALPFSDGSEIGGDRRDYRVLANQYNETLVLKTADKGVPNRGVIRETDDNLDQTIVALDYEQLIKQFRSEDNPVSGKAKEGEVAAIHHEPGLWLQILNHHKSGADIARLGTIPHGNSVLALGTAENIDGKNPVVIEDVNPFPFLTATGQVPLDDPLENYLAPYQKFVAPANEFFPNNLDLRNLHGLLQAATPTNVKTGMKFSVSTEIETGGIVNTPFIVEQADAAVMRSTFWVMELEGESDNNGDPIVVMQYMQEVMLDFFDMFDNSGGRIRWPHISLNTMVRTAKDPADGEEAMRWMRGLGE